MPNPLDSEVLISLRAAAKLFPAVSLRGVRPSRERPAPKIEDLEAAAVLAETKHERTS